MGGRILANVYNRNYLEGLMTKTEIWSPVTSYYDILAAPHSGLMYANTPWSGYYDVQSTIWVTAHTTQFAQPGWQYLDSGCGFLLEDGSYVALRSPNYQDWSVIVETISARHSQTIRFRLTGGLSVKTVHIWETNAGKTFEQVAAVEPVNGTVTVTFDPDSLYSLTTTTGQAKGTAQPPTNTPFPLPYGEDFDGMALNHAPKFLSDQDGAFEVHPCRERSGQCLEQVIIQKPIPWMPIPNPFTMAGAAEWTDYTLSADMLLNDANEATLMGRIDSADVFQDVNMLWPSAYVLRLGKNGNWTLLSAKYKTVPRTLASGTIALDVGKWHHLQLEFKGNQIRANLDNQLLTALQDSTHTHGMIAIGTDWSRSVRQPLRPLADHHYDAAVKRNDNRSGNNV